MNLFLVINYCFCFKKFRFIRILAQLLSVDKHQFDMIRFSPVALRGLLVVCLVGNPS